MKIAGVSDSQKTALEALNDPQPGDYWSDHFCPILIVLDVQGDVITTCSKKIAPSPNHWSFDINHQVVMTKAELKDYLSYKNPAMLELPWAECSPHRKGSLMFKFIESAAELEPSNKVVTRFVPKNATVDYDSRILTIPGKLSERLEDFVRNQDILLNGMSVDHAVELKQLLRSLRDYLNMREQHPKYLSVRPDVPEAASLPIDDPYVLGVNTCYSEILKANDLLTESSDLQKQVLLCLSAGRSSALVKAAK